MERGGLAARTTGRSLQLVGQLLTVVGWVGWFGSLAVGSVLKWDWGLRVLVIFGASLCLGLAVFLKNRGKRLVALDVATARKRDPRPPVVYLRQFIADDRVDAESALGIDSSLEQSLVRALSSVGPVIALSRPGERLPPPGAARRSATNEEWQQVIEGWLREAKLVVLLAGASDSVAWEISRCGHLLRPEQFVVVVPPGLDWAKFREATEPHFGRALPAQAGASGLVVFGEGFEPAFLPDSTTALQRGNRMGNGHVLFQQNLQPVFTKLGVASAPPSALTPTFRAILIVLAVLAALVGTFIVMSGHELRQRRAQPLPSGFD